MLERAPVDADAVTRSAEAALPQGVADDRGARAGRRVLPDGEVAPQQRWDSQNVEEVGFDAAAGQAGGVAGVGDALGAVAGFAQLEVAAKLLVQLLVKGVSVEPAAQPADHANSRVLATPAASELQPRSSSSSRRRPFLVKA